jgi:hypothetical protein
MLSKTASEEEIQKEMEYYAAMVVAAADHCSWLGVLCRLDSLAHRDKRFRGRHVAFDLTECCFTDSSRELIEKAIRKTGFLKMENVSFLM